MPGKSYSLNEWEEIITDESKKSLMKESEFLRHIIRFYYQYKDKIIENQDRDKKIILLLKLIIIFLCVLTTMAVLLWMI